MRRLTSVAAWILEHVPPSKWSESLAGDLLEELEAGRSPAWFWRQVLDAVRIGAFQRLVRHRSMTLFAVAWAMPAPAWVLGFANLEQHFHLNLRFLSMDWPWSILCDWALLLAANLVFIWAGIFLYLLPRLWIRRRVGHPSLGRGMLASVPILLALWAALIVLPKYFLLSDADHLFVSVANAYPIQAAPHRDFAAQQEWAARHTALRIDHDPRYALADFRMAAISARLPFFLIVLCSLWGASSSPQPRRRLAA